MLYAGGQSMNFNADEYAMALDEFLVNMEKKIDSTYADLQDISEHICQVLNVHFHNLILNSFFRLKDWLIFLVLALMIFYKT